MTRERIEGWIDAEEGFSVVGSREDAAYDFILVVEGEGAQAGRAEVRMREDGDRVGLVRAWTLPADASPDKERSLFEKVSRAVGRLPALSGLGVRRDGGSTLELSSIVYLDGLSRHTFVSALIELMRAGAGANDTLEKAGAADAFAPAPAQPAAAPTVSAPTEAEAFAPTHKVPATGMSAWATPDPQAPIVTQLAGGVELRILEQRGAWAYVMGSNGWTGWVDARLLQPR